MATIEETTGFASCTPKPSTVLILSYHFYPSNEIGARRVTALARYLANIGVRVVVVSAFGGQLVRPNAEVLPGVFAVPVARPKRGFLNTLVTLKRYVSAGLKNDTGRRLSGSGTMPSQVPLMRCADKIRKLYFRFLYFVDDTKKWAWRVSRVAVIACREYDARLIVASGPPHSALLAGAKAARKLGIPFVADLRDPWSDAHSTDYPVGLIELWLLRVLEGWVVKRAAAVTSTTRAVAALLQGRHEDLEARIYVVRNGYDGGVTPAPPSTGGRLSMLFAGELYVGRNPFPLLAGLEWLLTRPDVDPARIDVTFMGKADAYAGQSLEAWMQGKRCASVVRVVPPQSSQVVTEAINRSTLLLNLAQQQYLSVPAKTFEQLACGREVLLLCEDDCETAQLVAGIAGVTQVDPSNFNQLTGRLFDIYTRHVVRGELSAPSERDVVQFSRMKCNEIFAEILASLSELGPRSPRPARESASSRNDKNVDG